MWEMVALLEKELRHPLAEILYKEALVRSKVNGTNFNFILVSKPVQLDSGISAKILQKKSHQEIDILIGNKNIFSKSNVYLSQYESNSSTGIYLVADQVACMVQILLFSSYNLILTPI
jgi:Cu+-exporting ATPase